MTNDTDWLISTRADDAIYEAGQRYGKALMELALARARSRQAGATKTIIQEQDVLAAINTYGLRLPEITQ